DDVGLLAELAVGEIVEPHLVTQRVLHVGGEFLEPQVMRRILVDRRRGGDAQHDRRLCVGGTQHGGGRGGARRGIEQSTARDRCHRGPSRWRSSQLATSIAYSCVMVGPWYAGVMPDATGSFAGGLFGLALLAPLPTLQSAEEAGGEHRR